LFAVSENYPQLRASENFQQLQAQLGETENAIAVSRQIYNDTVLLYNNSIQTFPGVLIAGSFGFKSREYLEIEEASRAPVQVKFRTDDPPATQ
jgi:LemA protein